MQNIDINSLINEFDKQMHETKDSNHAIECRNIFIKKHLNPLYDQLKIAPNDQKKQLGLTANLLKNKINDVTNQRLEAIKNEAESTLVIKYLMISFWMLQILEKEHWLQLV